MTMAGTGGDLDPALEAYASSLAGDPDLLLYLAVCRRSGRAVLGPPPAVVFSEPPRSWLLEATAAELRWAAGRATFSPWPPSAARSPCPSTPPSCPPPTSS
jgi:hypothetical protein